MTATPTVVSIVSRRRRIQVDFDVNATQSYVQDVGSDHDNPSPELTAQFEAYVADYENGVKDLWPEWIVKDTSRNGTFQLTPRPDKGPGRYDCLVQWTVSGATARIFVEVDGSVEPEDEGWADWLQSVADAAASQWISEHGMIPV